MFKTILWDFDGVILDSMKIRDWGFEEVFKNFKKKDVESLLRYHRKNGGLSRYVKIRYFFEVLIGKTISEKEVLVYAEKFSRLMKKELINPRNLILDYISLYHTYKFKQESFAEYEELTQSCSLINVQLALRLSNSFKAILSAHNLLNEEYSPHISRVRGVAGGVPSPGRFFNMNLKYEF